MINYALPGLPKSLLPNLNHLELVTTNDYTFVTLPNELLLLSRSLGMRGGKWIVNCEKIEKLMLSSNADVRIDNANTLQELEIDESFVWCRTPIQSLKKFKASTSSNRSTGFESKLRKFF